MNENFEYKCIRRSRQGRVSSMIQEGGLTCEERLGAGSGGDPPDGGTTRYLEGTYTITAGRIQLATISPTGATLGGSPLPGAHCIDLLGDDGTGSAGLVAVRGTKGVRITSGPPKLPPMSAEKTDGVEVAVGDAQSIQLKRGTKPGAIQGLLMTKKSYNLVGSAATVAITSDTSITLSVAGGLSEIVLTPSGIVIKGLVVQIN